MTSHQGFVVISEVLMATDHVITVDGPASYMPTSKTGSRNQVCDAYVRRPHYKFAGWTKIGLLKTWAK